MSCCDTSICCCKKHGKRYRDTLREQSENHQFLVGDVSGENSDAWQTPTHQRSGDGESRHLINHHEDNVQLNTILPIKGEFSFNSFNHYLPILFTMMRESL